MKYLMIILTALFVSACNGKDSADSMQAPQANAYQTSNPYVLIISYDHTQTDEQQLLALGKKWNVELVYDYDNFHAVAIYIPREQDAAKVKAFYEKTKGVLQVNEDQINRLH